MRLIIQKKQVMRNIFSYHCFEKFMSLSKFIEEKIQKAIADGEFENFKGKGKPIDMET